MTHSGPTFFESSPGASGRDSQKDVSVSHLKTESMGDVVCFSALSSKPLLVLVRDKGYQREDSIQRTFVAAVESLGRERNDHSRRLRDYQPLEASHGD